MDKNRPHALVILSAVLVVSLVLGLTSCGGKSSSSSSTTTDPLTKITVSPVSATITIGQPLQMTALPVDTNNNGAFASLTWTSSSPSVATVDVNGKVVGVAAGTTQITASAVNRTTNATITSNTSAINVTSSVKSVQIAPMSSTVAVNGTQQFTATPLDAQGNPVQNVTISWFCSFSGVATVDGNGLVTGVSPGTVTIVASVGNIMSQPAALTVTP